jgi:hypothetical protein
VFFSKIFNEGEAIPFPPINYFAALCLPFPVSFGKAAASSTAQVSFASLPESAPSSLGRGARCL